VKKNIANLNRLGTKNEIEKTVYERVNVNPKGICNSNKEENVYEQELDLPGSNV